MTYPVAQLLTSSSFHPVRTDLAENAIKAALQGFTITTVDAAQIREFIAELRSCKNISPGRANKLTFTLITWRRFIGPFADNTIGDLYAAIPELRNAKSSREKPFKQNTISDFIAILKQFYLWMIENKYSPLTESKIHKLRTPPKDTMTKVAADLLTPDEITAMMKACTRTMDRALIMMLYEGGFRIGEIGTMTWGDLTFDKYGIYRERELQDQHAPVRPAHHGPGIPGTVTGLLQAGPERRTASLCERTRQAPYSCDH